MPSSESSASPSPSPPQSPEPSYHGPPNLERLVLHFVAAKRSLTSTSHVYRANELVTSSRSLIEDIAVIRAKYAFAKRGLDQQVDTLDAIRDSTTVHADKVEDDFNATLAALDRAHAKLEKTLNSLRKTTVDTKLEQQTIASEPESHSSQAPNAEHKALYDFIDEDTHQQLLGELRGLIDSYHDARHDLDETLGSFDNSLRSITEKLLETSDSGPPEKPTIYDEPPPSIQQLFRDMEGHATEMASLLSSLVDHYDLCVNALKHTEGGGEAAKIAVQTEELAKDRPATEESLYGKTVAEPISDEERAEMIHVIECDSNEVEDVVNDIREHIEGIEQRYLQLSKHAAKARTRHQTLRHVLEQMRQIRAAIPAHLDAAAVFRDTWQDINTSMQAKTKELADLSIFYEEFLAGYGKLLREVERRKAAETHIKKIAEEAQREIDNLYEADRAAREEFLEETSHVLPVDLAKCHGLQNEPVRWLVQAVHQKARQRATDSDLGLLPHET